MDESGYRLIVGLGNPGAAYASTRHNIGFMVVDGLAGKYSSTGFVSSFDATLAKGYLAGRPILVAKPMSYMNRSGPPVARILRNYQIQCEDMVVIHDDIDLAYERIKIKEKGGDGGHNGVRSLIDALGTEGFVRVRMGVGRPQAGVEMVDHVLGCFDSDQQTKLDPFLLRGMEAVRATLCEGTREAMNQFNRKP